MEIIDIMAVAVYFLTENGYRYTYNKHFKPLVRFLKGIFISHESRWEMVFLVLELHLNRLVFLCSPFSFC